MQISRKAINSLGLSFNYVVQTSFSGGTTRSLWRCINTRPDPRWRRKRAEKTKKIELPDWERILGDKKAEPSMEEAKLFMKKMGMLPPRRYDSTPINLQSTSGIFDPYVPPEGDGKASLISKQGIKEKYSIAQMKTQSVQAVRKIRAIEPDFKTKLFGETALDVYIKANETLVAMDEDKLLDYVTEKAFTEMMNEVRFKSIRWRYIQSLEPLKVVHVRTTDLLGKDNIFAQCTVRMHSQQMLVVYDRFGRLVYGSEDLPKNVLEYVVFEKLLTNEYGGWRVHGKVIPAWMPEPEPIWRTVRLASLQDEPSAEEDSQARRIRVNRSVSA